MKLESELIWFLPLITSLLSMIGGTWTKKARRIGVPVALMIGLYLFIGWTFWILVVGILTWGATTAPYTLKGDSVHSNGWQNWAWVYVVGGLWLLPSLAIGYHLDHLMTSAIVTISWSIIAGLFITFSNLPKTKRFFNWKAWELLQGIVVGSAYAFLVTI